MSVNLLNVKKHIRNFDFTTLFIDELGWNNPPRRQLLPVTIGQQTFTLHTVAEKGGFQVFLCKVEEGEIPYANERKKFEKQITPLAAEHLLIFSDGNKQLWQWALREPKMPLRLFTERFETGSGGERLAQKLQHLEITLEDEERGIGITDVTGRSRKAFYVEKVTRQFYKEFETEHKIFAKAIVGIADEKMRDWYASLMLNRLMFVYFIQAKGFLDGDADYLQNKLKACQRSFGKDEFFPFYRKFLLRLFHEGLGQEEHSSELVKLIGKVPYLNGGLFEVHKIEQENKDALNIPDDAFKKVFDFLDKYDWRLDDREKTQPQSPIDFRQKKEEINPDVLGYIFEKYINNKQMGAYYTKEDITEYISKNTILPFLLERVRQENRASFDLKEGMWQLLRENPDRYIYAALRKGVIDERNEIIETPEEIAAGLKDVSKRGGWNKPADDKYRLPTETWREYAVRRTRCLEIREKLKRGEIHEINDLITYNLDIRQFIQDAIEESESVDFVKALYRAVAGRLPEQSNEKFEHGISILDPTCGSGAFLFAALNILEPLFETCLDRMTDFVEEADKLGATTKYKPFRRVLEEIEHHPNREYFVLKSIIVGNLYGVDIMPEAVEICKLRLFLKLAARVEKDNSRKNFGLEPLPDIDFNIRAGNTLVGFVDKKSVDVCFDGDNIKPKLGFAEVDSEKSRFYEDVELTNRAFERFRLQQTLYGGKVTKEEKDRLRNQLKTLSDKLDIFLAREYGVNVERKADFEKWRKSHQPFHWLTEFYGIINDGGFDVIIGNPPYVEYSKVKDIYQIRKYKTEDCNNLYAFCTEKALKLLSKIGRFGMILPNSSISADKMSDLQNLLTIKKTWISNFAWRPAKLFEGANMLLAIILVSNNETKSTVSSTRYHRWYNDFRQFLFQLLNYHDVSSQIQRGTIPKFPDYLYGQIHRKILAKSNGKKVSSHFHPRSTEHFIFYFRAVLYWVKILDTIPIFKEDGIQTTTGEMKTIFTLNEESKYILASLLSSSLYSTYYTVWSSCQVINSRDFEMPFDEKSLDKLSRTSLLELGKKIQADYQENSKLITRNYSSRGRTFQMVKQYFYIKESKPIIDEIDRILQKHFGFTDEELDFIINYDIKYRIGGDTDE
jgi:type I restriction-modification system DNA methylase subunit